MTDINIGAITESLNYKSDLDLGNTSPQIVDYIVEQQLPSADNNYTWYDLYKSGKVRQGGYKITSTYQTNVTLLVEMQDEYYNSFAQVIGSNTSNLGTKVLNVSTTEIMVNTSSQSNFHWIVEGMSAGV